MNMRFEYLYRDAGNNKIWGSVVLTNREKFCEYYLCMCLRPHLIDSKYFEADRVELPELSFDRYDAELDHGWHEYHDIVATTEAADDVLHRDITDVIRAFEKAAEGWKRSAYHGRLVRRLSAL